MISYFTKQFQAVPALMSLQRELGGAFVSTRANTLRAIHQHYPQTALHRINNLWPKYSKGYAKLLASDLIVTGSPNNSLLKQFLAKKYMVFHGTFAPLSVTEAKEMAHFDRLCVLGPRMMHVIEQAGLAHKASYCGYLPFLENPEKNETARNAFLQNLGLNPANKTILYLPCGRPIGSWDFMAEKLVREIPAEFNLILRPHPSHSVSARLKDKLGYLRLNTLIQARGNAYLDLTTQKLSTVLAYGDLVISDGTSPAEESLYYDLPQLFVETPLQSRAAAKQVLVNKGIEALHIESVLRIYDCGKIITPQTNGLRDAIQNALIDANQFSKQRAEYFEYVFGARDFSAQNRLIEALRQYA